MKKRIVALVLTVLMVCTLLPVSVSATSKTADEAIAWVKSKVGTSIDYDGAYGAQCVDLILAYYNYLGVSTVSGNGKDYSWNALPSGWSRVQGGAPKKGDILVYTAGTYGHVAIYESDYSTYHQNYNSHSYVERITHHYNWSGSGYWGYIRPNFSSGAQTVSVSFSKWSNSNYTFIGETNAAIGMKVSVSGATPSYVGMILYNSSQKELARGGEYNTFIGAYFFNINTELNYTLQHATKYMYKFYAVVNGATYYSSLESFTTSGSHSYTTVVTKPTCTAQGYTTHTCSKCGSSYVDTYTSALGHRIITRNAKDASCTGTGYTGDQVCSVCGEIFGWGSTIAKLDHSYKGGVCTVCGAKDPDYKLNAPKVKASLTADEAVKLTWAKIDGATKYEVYRAASKSGTYTKMTTTTKTIYTNTSVKSGKTYYYKVRAICSDADAASNFSSVVSKTIKLETPVIDLTNVASSGKIKISWDEVANATKYEIYRATSKSGTYTKLKTTSNTYYTDSKATVGKTYYYKVRAICSVSAASSAYSSVKSRTCDLARPSVKITTSKGHPKLTWEEVSSATKYEVYRATSKNGTYTKMTATAKTSYTNTSATAGKTYYYKVRAICGTSAAASAYSTVVSVKAK